MRMGLPSVITSDQGKEFNNRLDKKLMNLLGIEHRLTTPYHPQVMFKFILGILMYSDFRQMVSMNVSIKRSKTCW